MESSGTTPTGGQSPAAIPDIAAAFDGPGPFVTVYLGTEAVVEQAAQQSELRWKNLRRQLKENGAPAETLAAIDPLVHDAHQQGRTLAVVADTRGFGSSAMNRNHRLATPLGSPHCPVSARSSSGRRASYRTSSCWPTGPAPTSSSSPAAPTALARVEPPSSLWGREAAMTRCCARTTPGAGPSGATRRGPRTSGSRTPGRRPTRSPRWLTRSAPVSSSWPATCGRSSCCASTFRKERRTSSARSTAPAAPGSGIDEIADDVVKLAATVVAEDTVELLRWFKQERGRNHLAVEGAKNTIEALVAARVDTLLIHDDPDDDRTAWFGPEPGMVAQTKKALTGLGVAKPQKARLVDVAIRAAFTTGAAVRIVPSVGSVKQGIGAILRF